eukprot:gb/GECG01006889.1/.p1 GENE.gb/GECG01006889.1/~~gb/GECG01006889.1/.p1  ORF type:complete len:217 (+),score=12.77 gb/GECG01006889.1/:1-651(+)
MLTNGTYACFYQSDHCCPSDNRRHFMDHGEIFLLFPVDDMESIHYHQRVCGIPQRYYNESIRQWHQVAQSDGGRNQKERKQRKKQALQQMTHIHMPCFSRPFGGSVVLGSSEYRPDIKVDQVNTHFPKNNPGIGCQPFVGFLRPTSHHGGTMLLDSSLRLLLAMHIALKSRTVRVPSTGIPPFVYNKPSSVRGSLEKFTQESMPHDHTTSTNTLLS